MSSDYGLRMVGKVKEGPEAVSGLRWGGHMMCAAEILRMMSPKKNSGLSGFRQQGE